MTVELTARVVRGLEWVAADEIAALPTVAVTGVGARHVNFTATDATRAIELRAVDDVFVRVGTVGRVGRSATSVAATARAVAALDITAAVAEVAALRSIPQRPAVDIVVSLDGDRRFSRFDLEDAVGHLVAAALGGTHGSRRHGAPPPSDLCLRITVRGDQADVAVRLASRPLHRRAWKQDTGPGTLHPPVAAALVRLAGPAPLIIDPFCGDGTIPIEAAIHGRGVVGADLDARRLASARANARRAGADLPFVRSDAGAVPVADRVGSWVTNPPWAATVPAAGQLRDGLVPAWTEAARTATGDSSLTAIADDRLALADTLRSRGWSIAIEQPIRLAGRLCDVVVAAASSAPDPVTPGLRAWQAQTDF